MLTRPVSIGEYVFMLHKTKTGRIRGVSRQIVEHTQSLLSDYPTIYLVGSGRVWPSCDYHDLFHTYEDVMSYLYSSDKLTKTMIKQRDLKIWDELDL